MFSRVLPRTKAYPSLGASVGQIHDGTLVGHEGSEGLDLVLVDENPLENLKVLYGTGAVKLNDDTGEVERVTASFGVDTSVNVTPSVVR